MLRFRPMTQQFTIGLLQKKCSPDPQDNLDRTITGIRDAAKRGARIICTQELFRTQYFCREENHDNFDLAEPIPGPTTETLGKVAEMMPPLLRDGKALKAFLAGRVGLHNMFTADLRTAPECRPAGPGRTC